MEGGAKYLAMDYATTFTASVFNIRQNVVTPIRFLNYSQTGEVNLGGAELSPSAPGDNVTDCQLCFGTHLIGHRR